MWRTGNGASPLPPGDSRAAGTIAAIQKELCRDGLTLLGRREEAQALFERLLSLRNGVGLLSKEYDPGDCRLVGNLPQAFSHLALVASASALAGSGPDEV